MRSLFTLRFDLKTGSTEAEADTRDALMVFVTSPELDPEEFASTVETEIEANLVPDEVAIIVREPVFDTTLTELKTHSLHISTLDRFGKSAAVVLIGYDCMGREKRRNRLAGKMPQKGMTIDDVRRRGITSIFNERRGFVEANATYHFENPSGRHTERFIRLSNILVRGSEVAFIGFCCMPYIAPDVTKAYLDTPSLYAIVAAVNEQRASFKDAAWILADNFSSYAGFDEYEFDGDKNAVVLISASSSGSLAGRLVAEKNVEQEQIVHLLYLGRKPSTTPVVCDLSLDDEANPAGVSTLPSVSESDDCPMCMSGSHAIKLQGDQFEFAGPQQDPLLIGVADAPKGLSALMGRYACTQVFELGLGRGGSKTPRMFHINAEKLLEAKTFQEKLEYALRRSLPGSLSYVIATDGHSTALAKWVANHCATKPPVLARDQIDTIPVNTVGAVVVVVSVIESGRTLLDISRDLRSIAPSAPLIYLAGMAKTTAEHKRERLENSLIQTHNPFPYQLVTVDQIVLPASADGHAWAAELNLLVDPKITKLVTADLKPAIDARIARLRLASSPMTDDLFVSNAGNPLRLQPGFVFWPKDLPNRPGHRQVDVFFTIASVLQRLRANSLELGERRIISNWFQQTILAPGNFGRFNDDVIQASLLRAAYPYELNFADTPAESREMGRLLRRVITACQSPRGGAASEFLLALGTRRLQLCRDDLKYVLEVDPPEIPMVSFLLKTCRLRLT